MIDFLTPDQRSEVMSRIRGKDTSPERTVRRLVYSLGYRFRLHQKRLPGTPDLVFSSRRKVIFVHGCFWHRHEGCKRASMPASRPEYWAEKFRRNVERDIAAEEALRKLGWAVLVVWQCELKTGNIECVSSKVSRFLETGANSCGCR
ncbi:very short patch repair endonuclease [Rhizobium leguminosarum]|uniref:very short patch repair endonuclease n=1 Tax=Rhizobium leguminosarum TaxID=384 RepID=UPI003F9579EF